MKILDYMFKFPVIKLPPSFTYYDVAVGIYEYKDYNFVDKKTGVSSFYTEKEVEVMDYLIKPNPHKTYNFVNKDSLLNIEAKTIVDCIISKDRFSPDKEFRRRVRKFEEMYKDKFEIIEDRKFYSEIREDTRNKWILYMKKRHGEKFRLESVMRRDEDGLYEYAKKFKESKFRVYVYDGIIQGYSLDIERGKIGFGAEQKTLGNLKYENEYIYNYIVKNMSCELSNQGDMSFIAPDFKQKISSYISIYTNYFMLHKKNYTLEGWFD